MYDFKFTNNEVTFLTITHGYMFFKSELDGLKKSKTHREMDLGLLQNESNKEK